MKTNVYVDGFNLYYGCVKGTPYKWLDLVAFFAAHLPDNQLHRVRYFTALVTPRPSDTQQPVRQQTYLRAIRTRPEVTVHLGQFLESRPRMRLVTPLPDGTDKVRVVKTEEKGSDVNIACYLLTDAFDDDCEAAVVVSNDSDLVEPIRIVRKRFGKRVVALMPCGGSRRMSVELQRVASKSLAIDPTHLPTCQFPDELTDQHGTIHKPVGW